MALDTKGNAYVTDSLSPVVWRANMESGQIKILARDLEFTVDPDFFNLNGIAVLPGDRFAIVSIPTRSGRGGRLYRIRLADGEVASISVPESFSGTDGLTVVATRRLVGTGGSSGLFVFDFDEDYRRVEIRPISRFDDALDLPTTSVILKDRLWVVNSQLDHFVFGKDEPPSLPFEIVGLPLDLLGPAQRQN